MDSSLNSDRVSLKHHKKQQSRQQAPVSCHFCRSRKLRCNREQPCSNCLSRGISCEILGRPVGSSPSTSRPSPTSTEVPEYSTLTVASVSQEQDVNQRLERLEKLVADQSERWDRFVGLDPQLRHEPLPSPNSLLVEDPGITTPRLPELSSQNRPGHNSVYSHVSWLENFQRGQERVRSQATVKLILKTAPLQQMPDLFHHFQMPSLIFPEEVCTSPFCIWLPIVSEAQYLLEKYIKDVIWFHHIFYIPHLRQVFNHVYAHLNEPDKLQPGQVALVLNVIASTLFYWTELDCGLGSPFTSVSTAINQSLSWLRVTIFMLETCHRLTFFSIELLQATIGVSLIAGNVETISQRYRHLLTMGLTMAYDMRLHLTDHPDNNGKCDKIEAEVKRRLWWHLVATDWMLAARCFGANEGVYLCQPRLMAVKKPSNIDDHDLTHGADPPDKPLSQITMMSYAMHRIRLGELARRIADRILFVSAAPGSSGYSDVVALDVEIEKFIGGLPDFFRLRSFGSIKSISAPNYPHFIVMQRYFLNQAIFSLRCKLNLPFLALGYTNKTYEHSREACLHAARMTIQSELDLEEEVGLPFVKLRLRMTGILNGLFLATSAFFMDICLRNAPVSQEIRQGATGHALRILEAVSEHSRFAGLLIRSMMQVLQKHSMENNSSSLQTDQGEAVITGAPATPISGPYQQGPADVLKQPQLTQPRNLAPANLGITGTDMGGNMEQLTGHLGDSMDLTVFFGQLAETFGSDPTAVNFDWNKILSELDSTFT